MALSYDYCENCAAEHLEKWKESNAWMSRCASCNEVAVIAVNDTPTASSE